MEQRTGRENARRTFEDALFNNRNEKSFYHYINHGFYAHHLTNYFQWFPRENFKIIFFEDFIGPKKSLIYQQIQEFLNVKPQQLETDLHTNKAITFKNPFIFKFYLKIFKNKTLYNCVKKALNKISFIKNFIKDITTSNNPALSQQMIYAINNTIYKEDIKQLEQLLSVNLSHWYQKQCKE